MKKSYDLATGRDVLFWANVQKTETCWLWCGYKDCNGYGRLSRSDVPRLAHRWSWLLKHGELPSNKMVLHKCDNPSCVNPEHLFLGDAKDNAQDMRSKGRNRYRTFQGESHKNAKLTTAQVKDIRVALRLGMTQHSLARIFGVSQHTIWVIGHQRGWSHVS